MFLEKKQDSVAASSVLSQVLRCLETFTDPESVYRCVLALGTLINENGPGIRSSNSSDRIIAILTKVRECDNSKAKSCACSIEF